MGIFVKKETEMNKKVRAKVLTEKTFREWLNSFEEKGTKKSWIVMDKYFNKKLLLWGIEGIFIWPFIWLYDIIKGG